MVDVPDSLSFDSPQIFDALGRVSAALLRANSSEQMLEYVLEEVLDIFDCDRAWLMYPCDPEADFLQVQLERTRPDWPGAGSSDKPVPLTEPLRDLIRKVIQTPEPIPFDDEHGGVPESDGALKEYGIRSQMAMVLYPSGDEPWLFGIHHCRAARRYREAIDLFRAIGSRINDTLTSLIAIRELRQSEERFRRIVEHAPEAIVILDCTTGQFVEANPHAQALFGLSRDKLLRLGGPSAVSPELQPDGQRSEDVIRAQVGAALDGRFPTFEWTHRDASGREIPCEVRLAHLPHPTQRLVRGSVIDITQRKRSEEERAELEARLAQAQKLEAIGQLTGGIAHDFNNLLTVILGNLELVEGSNELGERVARQVRNAHGAADRASALTHRLLAFARRQPLRPSALDVGQLLRGMDELLRRTLGEEIEIELVLGGGLWKCEADAAQLENAMLNLAINARDAMNGGGRLTIEAGNARLDHDYALQHEEVKPGQYVLIAVTDDGTGIPEDLMDEIFEPFFTTKDVGVGSGLGLSMVFGFVKQSGGHVKAYSEEGVGTTMKLYLPRASAESPTMDRALRNSGSEVAQGETILVVEDSEDVRALTQLLLEQLGYHVLVAEDAESALQTLEKHDEIDLLFTDVVLPGGMNGSELAKTATERAPGLRVLYMSGYTENAIIHNGRLDPGVQLVEKPFTKKTLALRVREALEH